MKRFVLPLIVLVAAGLLIAVFAIGNNSGDSPNASSSPAATVRTDPAGLPGLLTGASPWSANTDALANRLNAIGLPQLSAEGTAMHIHQHLDLLINGQTVSVPADIGINTAQNFIATIHTHDTTGIVHVESPTVQSFYLGQFFDVWGVKFTQSCIGSYCSNASNALTVYVNGTKQTGDPRTIKLDAHQEIAIVYGPIGQTPPTIPSSYSFPSGY